MPEQSACCETRYGKYVHESRERLVLTYLYKQAVSGASLCLLSL